MLRKVGFILKVLRNKTLRPGGRIRQDIRESQGRQNSGNRGNRGNSGDSRNGRASVILQKLRQYRATSRMCTQAVFDGGLLSVGAEYLVYFIQFVLLVLIWRSFGEKGAAAGGMTLSSLLTYTLMASVLRQQMDIITPATSALWEGSITGRYLRPYPILGGLAAETIGRWWVPVFLFYTVPVMLIAPFMGISPLPASAPEFLMFAVSLLLSVSLGFALDFIYASLAIRMKDGCWAAQMIRETLAQLFTGALIPFALLPGWAARILTFLPTGSIASAPLTIYVGAEGSRGLYLIGLQIFWNLVLWPAALWVFRKSEERMISYGG